MMTIEDLMSQFDFREVESVRDDMPGKTLVVFKHPFYFQECDDGILQFLAMYDEDSRVIKAIRLYGFNMRGVLRYIEENKYFLWCRVIHYIQDVYSVTPSITILTAL